MDLSQMSLDQIQDQLEKPLTFTQTVYSSQNSDSQNNSSVQNSNRPKSKEQKIYISNDQTTPQPLLSQVSGDQGNLGVQVQNSFQQQGTLDYKQAKGEQIAFSKSSKDFALQRLEMSERDVHSPQKRIGSSQEGATGQTKISAIESQGKIKISLDIMSSDRKRGSKHHSKEQHDDALDEFQKHYSLNLGKVVRQKQTLDHAINSMDIRISDTFLRQNLQLENKYLPVEDDAKRVINALELKAKRLEEQNLANATYCQIIQDLQNFKKTADTLRHKLSSISQSHQLESKKNQKLKRENQTKHLELYKYSKQNLGLSYQIQEMLQQLQQVKNQHQKEFPQQYRDSEQKSSLFLTDAPNIQNMNNRFTSMHSNQNQSIYAKQFTLYPDFNPNLLEEVISMVTTLNNLERQIAEVKQDKKEHIAEHYSKLISVIDMQRMFNQCFAAYEHQILKNQQLQNPEREEGMNQSFFFQLQRRAFNRSGIQKNKSQEALKKMKNKYPINLIDLQLKDVIYGTLKSLANAAKENKKRAHILSVGLDWEDFNNFTPKQIVGLLLLRDDGLEKLRQFALPQLGKSLRFE